MHTTVIIQTAYLVKLPGRAGFYFQRKVPADIVQAVGKRLWRWKAGNTLVEARRACVEALAKTDELIASHRGEVTPELLNALDRRARSDHAQELEELGLSPQDIWPRHSIEDAHKLVERQSGISSKTTEDLWKLAKRLKNPATGTARLWTTYLKQLVEITGKDDVTLITEDDARKYRDVQLDKVAGSSFKTRLRYLRALFNVAVDDGWITKNPFDCIKLRYIKAESKPKEAMDLADVDLKVVELPEHQQILYWIMRYTGTHISEAAGIRHEDVDLNKGVIYIRPNELRPLKNRYRERALPIIEPLQKRLNELYSPGNDYVFDLYSPNLERWGHKINWKDSLGIMTKACRDAVATTLRDKDVNERVIGAILGHTPTTSTGVYGSVSMEAKRAALQYLCG